MTHFERQYGREKAVLWAKSTTAHPFDADGQPKLTSASEIDVVGWNESQSEALQADGTPVRIDASCRVFQDITEGSFLWRGKKRDLPGTVASYTDLREVVSCDKTDDVKGHNTTYRVGMVKRASLATVV